MNNQIFNVFNKYKSLLIKVDLILKLKNNYIIYGKYTNINDFISNYNDSHIVYIGYDSKISNMYMDISICKNRVLVDSFNNNNCLLNTLQLNNKKNNKCLNEFSFNDFEIILLSFINIILKKDN